MMRLLAVMVVFAALILGVNALAGPSTWTTGVRAGGSSGGFPDGGIIGRGDGGQVAYFTGSGHTTLTSDPGFLESPGGLITVGAGAGSLTLNTAAGTNAVCTEAGVSKNSGATESFAFTNPGAGVCDVSADGVFLASDGLVSRPAFTFTSDPDSGLYSQTANMVSMAAGGVEYSRWGANVFTTGVDGLGMSGTTANVGVEILATTGDARLDVGRPDTASYYGVFEINNTTKLLRIGALGTNNTGMEIRTNDGATIPIIFTPNNVQAAKFDNSQQLVMLGDFNWIPTTTDTGHIGTDANKFNRVRATNIVSGDLHLQDEARNVHWLLREEEDGISVVNKITGKRYKMALVEDGEESVVAAPSWWKRACQNLGVCQ